MSIDISRFHQTFFEESFEGLDVMESALLKLDVGSADAETINTIFRAAHSMKGGAGTFGFTAVAEYTHLLETLLDQMRAGQRAVNAHDVDILLRSVDVVRALLTSARDGTPVDTVNVATMKAELEGTLSKAPEVADRVSPTKGAETVAASAATSISKGWKIRFVPHAGMFRSGNDPTRILREIETLGTMTAVLDETRLPSLSEANAADCHMAWDITLESSCSLETLKEVFAWVEDECDLHFEAITQPLATTVAVDAADATPKLKVAGGTDVTGAAPAKVTTHAGEGSIRVGTEKIDSLINLVGELVITQAMLAQQASVLDPVANEKLLSGLSQLDRNTRSLQEAVMSIRMLPMDFVFSRFPRLVRDTATKFGKQVRLTLIGESVELDKSVIEKIADPLTHLVRNSLDHGIEMPDVRLAAGKESTGTITLKAAHRGGSIVIEVTDDGRGLDRMKILSKAAERGIAISDNATDAEVWQLIFAPGFSTADKVTDISGRGVGMDVVKKNIQALGGQVDITSTAGMGMNISIRLPLTLAILDGMSVAVGDEIFIVPLNCVSESLQPQPEDVKSISGQGKVIRVRNEYLSLIRLRDMFNLGVGITEPHKGIVVLLESEGRKLALLVDELVGQQQVVIKSLESNYRRIPGVSGATIMGDGRVALILDVGDLVRANASAQAA